MKLGANSLHLLAGLFVSAQSMAELQNVQTGGLRIRGEQAHPLVQFEPAPDIQEKVQEAFILAEPGTQFRFAAGRYDFTMGLSLDVDNVAISGAGMDKTIFTFKTQDAGSEGLLVTSDNVSLEDLAIEDAKGNCFKSNGAKNLTIRRVRAEWTGGPKETNGAYGFYPVSGQNILIEDSVVMGASDAGIYVGQSENIIVRNNTVKFNVAGIEIENCHGADVYGNTATQNTGGILVFDLPGLPMQRGRDVRVFQNKVFTNDTVNFAPKGNIVGTVPTGTGIMVMSNSNVEIFENEIRDNGTTNLLLSSYLTTGKELTDPNYYPYPEGINIHGNTFGPGGNRPLGEGGMMIALVTGNPVPDIVWDGIINEKVLVDGKLPENQRIVIGGNTKTEGELTFANLNIGPDGLPRGVKRDLAEHAGTLPPVRAIALADAQDVAARPR